MPTYCARFYRSSRGERGGIGILDSRGELLPEAHAVLEVVAGSGLALASGHLSPSETLALFGAAADRGCERLIATHPTGVATDDELREMTRLGAFVEYTWLSCLPSGGGDRSGGARHRRPASRSRPLHRHHRPRPVDEPPRRRGDAYGHRRPSWGRVGAGGYIDAGQVQPGPSARTGRIVQRGASHAERSDSGTHPLLLRCAAGRGLLRPCPRVPAPCVPHAAPCVCARPCSIARADPRRVSTVPAVAHTDAGRRSTPAKDGRGARLSLYLFPADDLSDARRRRERQAFPRASAWQDHGLSERSRRGGSGHLPGHPRPCKRPQQRGGTAGARLRPRPLRERLPLRLLLGGGAPEKRHLALLCRRGAEAPPIRPASGSSSRYLSPSATTTGDR